MLAMPREDLMKTKLAVLTFVLITWLFLPSTVKADGIIIPDPPPIPEPMPISQLEIRYHHVDVDIRDQIATTRVDQVFYNPNDWAVEGTYVFPIPREASVSAFALWIDGHPVEGEVMDAEQARQTYEQIVRQMKDPALLEYADRDALRARIFPIPSGGERRIELEYTQVLSAEGGLVRYVYPLNTEKFSTQPLESVRVSVDVKTSTPIRAVYSPSHPVAVSRENDFAVKAGYEQQNVLPDEDFALYYSIGESEAFHLFSYRDPTDQADPDGFFLLLLAPRPDAEVQTVPKDVILVLDRSGSMEGEKFHQAQDAARYILDHLNPDDRFNLVAFSTGTESFANTLQPASQAESASAWVSRQSPVGSTDINRALLEAAVSAEGDRPTYLIFLTDGLPTEGVLDSQQILTNFAANAPANIRLFSFGLGYDVDTYLLDSLAQANHGTSTYVLPGERLDETLSSFYAKISTPVLIDLSLDFGEVIAYDIYPLPLPDLFAGSQIIVVGRYRQGGTTDVKLSGSVNGEAHTFRFPAQKFASHSSGWDYSAAIPRLWATRKIGYLLNQIRLYGPEQELVDQIVRLSIRYGIVTPYTSYLVTEPMPLGAEEQDRIAEEAYAEMEAAPEAPSYGQEAVEKAAAQGALENAEAVERPSPEVAEIVRFVGDRAFVASQGVWVDTAYDPDVMETVKVAFLSEDYFALTQARPSLGAAFALGERVIAMSGGIAYEVVPADQAVPPVEIPAPEESAGDEDPATLTFGGESPLEVSEPSPGVDPAAPSGGSGLACLGLILPLLVTPLMGHLYQRS
jgi:Ca-activated chloride channel family protein